MASAVALGNKFAKKHSRPVFERPQQPASAGHDLLQVPFINLAGEYDEGGEDGLKSSRSSPFFTFMTDDAGGGGSPTFLQPKVNTMVTSPLPASPFTLRPPLPGMHVDAATSSISLLDDGTSVVSLVGDMDESPGIGKNWKQMQVSPSPLLAR